MRLCSEIYNFLAGYCVVSEPVRLVVVWDLEDNSRLVVVAGE